MPIDPSDLDPDPLAQLAAWLAEAEAHGAAQPEAFALATSTADGSPSVRMVLLRGLGPDGLRFFTNRSSRKGGELAANPRVAVAFHWPELGRQVRLAGTVEQLPEAETAAYWVTRPRGHRLSAWASEQGTAIESRDVLEARVTDLERRYPDDAIPPPPFWSGYRLTPTVFEFWESRADRLHDRVEYVREADGGWRRRRLQP
jgi:pyridoxamine 5'-phosphate oxidase